MTADEILIEAGFMPRAEAVAWAAKALVESPMDAESKARALLERRGFGFTTWTAAKALAYAIQGKTCIVEVLGQGSKRVFEDVLRDMCKRLGATKYSYARKHYVKIRMRDDAAGFWSAGVVLQDESAFPSYPCVDPLA